MKSFKIKATYSEYLKFIEILDELNKISDRHKIKWSDEFVYLYSIDGEGVGDQQKVDALKIFIIKRDKLFKEFPENLNLTYVMFQTKSWVKQAKFLLDDNEDVEITFNYMDDRNIVYSIQINNSILQLSYVGDSDNIKNFPPNFIQERMNPKFANWTFELPIDTYKRIKKLSKLKNDSLISLASVEGETFFREEATWDFKINPIQKVNDGIWHFKKDHLDKATLDGDKLLFGVFESYILIQEKESLLIFNLDLMY